MSTYTYTITVNDEQLVQLQDVIDAAIEDSGDDELIAVLSELSNQVDKAWTNTQEINA